MTFQQSLVRPKLIVHLEAIIIPSARFVEIFEGGDGAKKGPEPWGQGQYLIFQVMQAQQNT
jgi:hypothetical protein